MWLTLLYGGMGGVFAPCLSLAQDLTGSGKPPPNVLAWIIGVAIFFALGAIVASISKEQVPLKAMAIGISLPAMLTVYNHGPVNPSEPAPPSSAAIGVLLTPALAQETAARQIAIKAAADIPIQEVLFYGPSGSIGPSLKGPVNGPVAVPANATSVAVRGPLGWSRQVALPPSSATGTLNLNVDRRSDFSISFRQALGISSAPYQAEFR